MTAEEDSDRNTVVVIPSSDYHLYSELYNSYRSKKTVNDKKLDHLSDNEVAVTNGALQQTSSNDTDQPGHSLLEATSAFQKEEETKKRPQAETEVSSRKTILEDLKASFDSAKKQIPRRYQSQFNQFQKLVSKSKRIQKQLGKYNSDNLSRLFVRHFTRKYKRHNDTDHQFQKLFRDSDLKYLFAVKNADILKNKKWWSLQ